MEDTSHHIAGLTEDRRPLEIPREIYNNESKNPAHAISLLILPTRLRMAYPHTQVIILLLIFIELQGGCLPTLLIHVDPTIDQTEVAPIKQQNLMIKERGDQGDSNRGS